MKSIIQKLANSFGYEIRRLGSRGSSEHRPTSAQDDDFNWNTYNDHYRDELQTIQYEHTLTLAKGDYEFDHGALKQQRDILPLHPNHRLLYETILLLKPNTVIEMGCGGGDHLANLSVLNPSITTRGLERSDKQIAYALERHPELREAITQFDASLPVPVVIPPADICYTQAVIMHMKTGNNHLVALSNMFRLGTKQVVLMENWRHHNFVADIKSLHNQRIIPWKEIFLYFRRAPELDNQPHLMVASANPIDGWETLSSDAILSQTVDQS